MDLAISTMLDLAIVAILVISVILGVRRGLIRSVISLVGSLVALILALVFSANLGVYIDEHYVNAPMREWLIGELTTKASDDVSATDIDFDDYFVNKPEFLVETCEFLGVDVDDIAASYESLKSDGVEQAKGAVVSLMVDPLSSVISRVIAFAVIFVAAMIAIVVISLFSKFLNNLPILRKLDKLGGGILGAITGVLLVFILVAIVSSGSKYVLKDRTSAERNAIREKTVVYKMFYQMDPLTHLFESDGE